MHGRQVPDPQRVGPRHVLAVLPDVEVRRSGDYAAVAGEGKRRDAVARRRPYGAGLLVPDTHEPPGAETTYRPSAVAASVSTHVWAVPGAPARPPR
jgi:hypothetical protein